MSASMVPCSEHSTSGWCYLQDDWSHIDIEGCACTVHPVSWCNVDAHRHAAETYIDEQTVPVTFSFERNAGRP